MNSFCGQCSWFFNLVCMSSCSVVVADVKKVISIDVIQVVNYLIGFYDVSSDVSVLQSWEA